MVYRLITLIMVALPLLSFGKKKERPDTVTARRAFIEMGPDGLDILSRNDRMDMLDYYDNDSIYSAYNNLGGKSQIESLTADYLALKLTDAGTLQMKVLPLKDGREILMTIHTVGDEGSARDSRIEFYDASLNPLPADRYLPEIKVADYFDVNGASVSMREIEGILPFYSYVFETGPGRMELNGKISLDDILTEEDAAIVKTVARPGVTYRWNGRRYVKE